MANNYSGYNKGREVPVDPPAESDSKYYFKDNNDYDIDPDTGE